MLSGRALLRPPIGWVWSPRTFCSRAPSSRNPTKDSTPTTATFNLSKALDQDPIIERDPSPSLSFVPFESLIRSRRDEASRSLMIQVQGVKSAHDLHRYCSEEFGPVKGMHFHENKGSEFPNFFLVEFKSRDAVSVALSRSTHRIDSDHASAIPVTSHFLWFSNDQMNRGNKKSSEPSKIPIHRYTNVQVNQAMTKACEEATLDGQIQSLYSQLRMNDISSRIRFMACQQIEYALSSLFGQAQVLPFGSSVNSFGQNGSDLDMVVAFNNAEQKVRSSRMVFHAKAGGSSGYKAQTTSYVHRFSHIIQAFLPGCQDVLSLLHAKVPIVKYRQNLLGLDCDLTVGSLSGHYMAELLYIYGELDHRVRPLFSFFRIWAVSHNLTDHIRPTKRFTSFTLIMMVIFFLQNQTKMLPRLNQLRGMAGPADRRMCDDGVDCSFVRNISGLQPKLNARYSQSDLTMASILFNFFSFYATVPNESHTLCVLSGELQAKVSRLSRNHGDLDITNPFDHELNLAANVRCMREFKAECAATAKVLENMLGGKIETDLRVILESRAGALDATGKNIGRINLASLLDGDEAEMKKVYKNAERPKDGSQSPKPKREGRSNYAEEKRRFEYNTKRFKRMQMTSKGPES